MMATDENKTRMAPEEAIAEALAKLRRSGVVGERAEEVFDLARAFVMAAAESDRAPEPGPLSERLTHWVGIIRMCDREKASELVERATRTAPSRIMPVDKKRSSPERTVKTFNWDFLRLAADHVKADLTTVALQRAVVERPVHATVNQETVTSGRSIEMEVDPIFNTVIDFNYSKQSRHEISFYESSEAPSVHYSKKDKKVQIFMGEDGKSALHFLGEKLPVATHQMVFGIHIAAAMIAWDVHFSIHNRKSSPAVGLPFKMALVRAGVKEDDATNLITTASKSFPDAFTRRKDIGGSYIGYNWMSSSIYNLIVATKLESEKSRCQETEVDETPVETAAEAHPPTPEVLPFPDEVEVGDREEGKLEEPSFVVQEELPNEEVLSVEEDETEESSLPPFPEEVEIGGRQVVNTKTAQLVRAAAILSIDIGPGSVSNTRVYRKLIAAYGSIPGIESEDRVSFEEFCRITMKKAMDSGEINLIIGEDDLSVEREDALSPFGEDNSIVRPNNGVRAYLLTGERVPMGKKRFIDFIVSQGLDSTEFYDNMSNCPFLEHDGMVYVRWPFTFTDYKKSGGRVLPEERGSKTVYIRPTNRTVRVLLSFVRSKGGSWKGEQVDLMKGLREVARRTMKRGSFLESDSDLIFELSSHVEYVKEKYGIDLKIQETGECSVSDKLPEAPLDVPVMEGTTNEEITEEITNNEEVVAPSVHRVKIKYVPGTPGSTCLPRHNGAVGTVEQDTGSAYIVRLRIYLYAEVGGSLFTESVSNYEEMVLVPYNYVEHVS
jgi:hypothetical protein